mmetsp:Transcript_7364/g.18851  ORF Transcript_7364/g.18851 Transcript_7364/m.18851 type:complete len:296 (-) Transcript_7364:78-965(-)
MRILVAAISTLCCCLAPGVRGSQPAGAPGMRRGVSVRRVSADDIQALYPNDWHDDPALRSRVLSDVSALVAAGLLGASDARALASLQKRVYTEYLHRFAVSPSAERALLVAFDDRRTSPIGSLCVEVCVASMDARREHETLVERDPSRRPSWPQPWDRRDPLAIARVLLGNGGDGVHNGADNGDDDTTFELRALIDGLVVAESWRRSGVGSALMGEAELLASQWGQSELRLRVEATNEQALAFYATQGYVQPTGLPAVLPGRKLVADGWGCKWAPAQDTVLMKRLGTRDGGSSTA